MGTETHIHSHPYFINLIIDKRKVPGGDGNKLLIILVNSFFIIDKRKVPGGDGNIRKFFDLSAET